MRKNSQVIRVWIEAVGAGVAGEKTARRLRAIMRLMATDATRAVTVAGWHWRATLHLPTDHLTIEPLPRPLLCGLEFV